MDKLRVIGLMSGTSMDGIDIVLCEIHTNASGKDQAEYIASSMYPFPLQVRERLLLIAEGNFGGSREIALMNALLGKLYADAVERFCKEKNISLESIDLIGSHGQTLYHSLEEEQYLDFPVQTSLQLGDSSYLAERFSCPVINDFRVRDIAAGGLGAPLVPFVDYTLYGSDTEDLVYLNIGGISNITYIPSNGEGILGFDTGPGNMLIDQAVVKLTNGKQTYDKDALLAKEGKLCNTLLEKWLAEAYYQAAPPKNSGRENFGEKKLAEYEEDRKAEGISELDFLYTLSALTALCNVKAIQDFCPSMPKRLIVSGGGSRNPLIMELLAKHLPRVLVQSGDVLGYDNDAKEALAFAYLAYKRYRKEINTLPSTTGASHGVSMGKISI